MYREIGELKTRVDMLIDLSLKSEEKSDISRAAIHSRVNDLIERTAKVERSVIDLQDDVKVMKPVTDDVRRWKTVGMGALGAIGLAGVAMGVSFSDMLKRVANLLTGGKIGAIGLTLTSCAAYAATHAIPYPL